MSQNFNYNLPTKYLSTSMVTLWHKDRGKFFDKYFKKEKVSGSPSLELGKKVAKNLQSISETGDIEDEIVNFEDLVAELDILDYPEQEFTVEIDPGLIIYAQIDTAAADYSLIVDHKTGSSVWDLDRVKASGQLKQYALVVWRKLSVIPRVGINWMRTEHSAGGALVELTGDVIKLYNEFSQYELEQYEEYLIKTARAISIHYDLYLQGPDSEVRKKVDAYRDAYKKMKEWEKLANKLKREANSFLFESDILLVEGPGYRYSLIEKDILKFEDDEVKAEYNAEVKLIKENYIAEGYAWHTKSRYFQFFNKKN